MLKDKIKKISQKSGVYFWLDAQNKVLYVGRATNLKNRLSQYFLSNVDTRIKEMVSQAKKIKVIETKSLLEAIILEAKYIKKYWPKYNIRDKDGKSFIYIVITKKDFTYPLIIRGKDLNKYQDKNNKIFGPYQSFTLIKNALRIIRRIFPYGICQANSGKACFDYQIKLCPGSCLGKINKKDYQKNIRNIILLLEGKRTYLLNKLTKENPDQGRALKHLQDVSLLDKEKNIEENFFSRIEAYDISHFSGKEAYGAMTVFEDGDLNKKEYRLFKIKNDFLSDDLRALTEVLQRRLEHKEWKYPDLILVDGGKPQLEFLKNIFIKYKIKNVVGLSKFAGDKLVFLNNNKIFKKQVLDIKDILLKTRDEAHRFANSARKRKTLINKK